MSEEAYPTCETYDPLDIELIEASNKARIRNKMYKEVDKDLLIEKILSKPLIWNKGHKSYSNRRMVDQAWGQISREMDIPEDLCRKKWKYLRDQFAHEMGRIEVARKDGLKGKHIESQWAHFNALMFLKGITKPRTSLANLQRRTTKRKHDYVPNPKRHKAEIDDIIEECVDDREENVDFEETNATNEETPVKCEYIRPIRKSIKKNSNILEKIVNDRRKKENDDMLFFRSILPHVEKIPDNMKLRFRSRVQEIVEEFAYPQNTHSENNTIPPSYSADNNSTTNGNEAVDNIVIENVRTLN
ncbi:uncharacterized protein LOC129919279 [Episyrphus balteatus]|uniref:uncharacterized protein LOC129919279 n=1 Tax=Episyrphus balteatus TaxID=286459 RepID=UPI00248683F9|nr:uncharacterized protein LOC129919279 [Episyrphus balteatus]